MRALELKRRLVQAARAAGRQCAAEQGQAATEYALISLALLGGSMVSVFVFAPRAMNLYDAYIHGFYLLLGLPVP